MKCWWLQYERVPGAFLSFNLTARCTYENIRNVLLCKKLSGKRENQEFVRKFIPKLKVKYQANFYVINPNSHVSSRSVHGWLQWDTPSAMAPSLPRWPECTLSSTTRSLKSLTMYVEFPWSWIENQKKIELVSSECQSDALTKTEPLVLWYWSRG